MLCVCVCVCVFCLYLVVAEVTQPNTYLFINVFASSLLIYLVLLSCVIVCFLNDFIEYFVVLYCSCHVFCVKDDLCVFFISGVAVVTQANDFIYTCVCDQFTYLLGVVFLCNCLFFLGVLLLFSCHGSLCQGWFVFCSYHWDI